MKYSKLTSLSRISLALLFIVLDTATIFLLATKQFNFNVSYWFCLLLLLITRVTLNTPVEKIQYDDNTSIFNMIVIKAIVLVGTALARFLHIN